MIYRLITTSIIFLFLTQIVLAADITGKIKDSNNQPLATVNIVLLNPENNSLVKATLTDDNGTFTLEAIPGGAYLLKATLLGYEEYSSEKLTVDANNLELEDILLAKKNTALKEVTVRAQKPFIEVQADKLVVNVENSIVSAGSSILDVLQKSPGVNVDQNDNISLKGRQGVLIMMDGKLMPMSGTDLANVLKSMPSSSIEKLEIISNPGAKYDAAGTAGIINIKTKKDQRMGMNGTVNFTYGQGIYPKYNTSLNLNYRDKKFTAYFNYSYAMRYWFNHLMLNRKFYDTAYADLSKKLFTYDQDNYAVFDFNNHIITTGADYSIAKNTTIGTALSSGTNVFNPRADNRSRALGQNDELLYYFYTTGRHKNRYYNYSANLNIRHSFDTSGRELTADIDYAAYGNRTNQNFVTTYQTEQGTPYLPDYFLKSDLDGITQIRSLKSDYTHPLSSSSKLGGGFKLSYVTSDNEPLFYEKVNEAYILDAKRSNHFIYRENINAGYINYNKDWTKWSAQLGLRAENTNVEAEQVTFNTTYYRNYTQLFPSFAVQRHLNTQHDLGVTLSRRIERPNYQQLNPFKFFIDKTTYREGYPYLNPALSYNVELSHTFKQRFITTLTYAITDDIITEVIQPSDNEDSVTVQTNKNLTRMTFYGISGAYPFQVTKWWSNVTNYNVYYALYEGFIANTNLRNGNVTFDVNTTNSFVLPRNYSAELSFWYQARQVYGFMVVTPQWMLNAGIQKNLFDRKATVRVNVQDIFWTGYPGATSVYTGYKEDFIAERETRVFNVSFTYRFGKNTVAPIRRHSGGAEDEKRRVGNG